MKRKNPTEIASPETKYRRLDSEPSRLLDTESSERDDNYQFSRKGSSDRTTDYKPFHEESSHRVDNYRPSRNKSSDRTTDYKPFHEESSHRVDNYRPSRDKSSDKKSSHTEAKVLPHTEKDLSFLSRPHKEHVPNPNYNDYFNVAHGKRQSRVNPQEWAKKNVLDEYGLIPEDIYSHVYNAAHAYGRILREVNSYKLTGTKSKHQAFAIGCAVLLNKSTNTRKLLVVTPGLKTYEKFEKTHYNFNEKIHKLFQTNVDHPAVRTLKQLKEEGMFSEILHFSQYYSDAYLAELKQFRLFDDKNTFGDGLYTCCEPIVHDECQKFLAEDPVNHTIPGTVVYHASLDFKIDGCSVFILPRPQNEPKISDKDNLFVYKDEKSNDLFYYIQDNPEKQWLYGYRHLPETSFQIQKTPCKNVAVKILNETTKRGHTKGMGDPGSHVCKLTKFYPAESCVQFCERADRNRFYKSIRNRDDQLSPPRATPIGHSFSNQKQQYLQDVANYETKIELLKNDLEQIKLEEYNLNCKLQDLKRNEYSNKVNLKKLQKNIEVKLTAASEINLKLDNIKAAILKLKDSMTVLENEINLYKSKMTEIEKNTIDTVEKNRYSLDLKERQNEIDKMMMKKLEQDELGIELKHKIICINEQIDLHTKTIQKYQSEGEERNNILIIYSENKIAFLREQVTQFTSQHNQCLTYVSALDDLINIKNLKHSALSCSNSKESEFDNFNRGNSEVYLDLNQKISKHSENLKIMLSNQKQLQDDCANISKESDSIQSILVDLQKEKTDLIKSGEDIRNDISEIERAQQELVNLKDQKKNSIRQFTDYMNNLSQRVSSYDKVVNYKV